VPACAREMGVASCCILTVPSMRVPACAREMGRRYQYLSRPTEGARVRAGDGIAVLPVGQLLPIEGARVRGEMCFRLRSRWVFSSRAWGAHPLWYPPDGDGRILLARVGCSPSRPPSIP